jgi:hypothetical protein
MKRKAISTMTEAKKEDMFNKADRYWEHHDRFGSGRSALKARAKMSPGGIPMRPLILKKYRDELKTCKGCSTKLFIDEDSIDIQTI